MRNKPIQVFEYELLTFGDRFKTHHWQALDKYNEQAGGKFFTLTSKGIKFNQHVGVIQVGNVAIEILPKISKEAREGEKGKWQKILIDMLRECRWMQVHAHEKASLKFKPNSILEAYLELFIQECEQLIRHGLIKRYRTVENNCVALKGKLLFNKHIQQNVVHQEHFYIRHQVYDRQNIYNQILYKGLKLIPSISDSPYLKDKVYSLLLAFPEMDDVVVSQQTFQKLVYNRKTLPYKGAIEIAAMLLLNYRPDISSGKNHILAILFDMNDLWEEYIYRQLAKHKRDHWELRNQNSKKFWYLSSGHGYKNIRPDIVVSTLQTANNKPDKSIIIDTKWKLPDNNIPADQDLKQMFVYNEYWSGINAILLYPKANYSNEPLHYQGEYKNKKHKCGVVKIAALDKDNSLLDHEIGKRLTLFIEKEFAK